MCSEYDHMHSSVKTRVGATEKELKVRFLSKFNVHPDIQSNIKIMTLWRKSGQNNVTVTGTDRVCKGKQMFFIRPQQFV